MHKAGAYLKELRKRSGDIFAGLKKPRQAARDFVTGYRQTKAAMDIATDSWLEGAINDYDDDKLKELHSSGDALAEEAMEYITNGDLSLLNDQEALMKERALYFIGGMAGTIASNLRERMIPKEKRQLLNDYRGRIRKKRADAQKQQLEEDSGGLVRGLEEDTFDAALAERQKVVVDFYGTPCPPCMQLAPLYAEAAERYSDKVLFCNINAYETEELTERYNIRGVPTVIVFDGGEEKDRMVGFDGKKGLEEFLEKNLE